MRLAALASRHSTSLLVLGILAGVALPDAASTLRPALSACIAGLLVVSMVRIPWPALRRELARPALPLALTGWLLVGCPLLTWLVLILVPVPAPLLVPIVLMAATPPLFSTPAMAFLWGLDAPVALVMVVLATLAGPFTLAAVAGIALGLDLGIEPGALAARLAALVGGSLIVSLLVRRIAGARRIEGWADRLNAVAVALLLVFAVAVMDGVADRFAREPGIVVLFTAAAFGANLVLQAVGALLARGTGMRRALTVGYATGNRALGLLLAVLPAGVAPDTVLFCALAQLPIYILPALLAPLYRRLGAR